MSTVQQKRIQNMSVEEKAKELARVHVDIHKTLSGLRSETEVGEQLRENVKDFATLHGAIIGKTSVPSLQTKGLFIEQGVPIQSVLSYVAEKDGYIFTIEKEAGQGKKETLTLVYHFGLEQSINKDNKLEVKKVKETFEITGNEQAAMVVLRGSITPIDDLKGLLHSGDTRDFEDIRSFTHF